MGFKIFVYGREFFHHKFEVLDGVVVIVSFILDIVLLFREHEFEAVGLLILLRLWRVARIINGRHTAVAGVRGLGLSELTRAHFSLPLSKEESRAQFSQRTPGFPCVFFIAGAWPQWGCDFSGAAATCCLRGRDASVTGSRRAPA